MASKTQSELLGQLGPLSDVFWLLQNYGQEPFLIQWQRALVVYMSLGQLDSWLCYLSDVSTPSDAAGRSRRPENRYIGAGRLVEAEFTEFVAVSCEFRFWQLVVAESC